MIKRILQITFLFSLLSLFIFTTIGNYLEYAWIVSLPVIFICLGYAIYRTKLFYYTKKIIFIACLATSFFFATSSSPLLAQRPTPEEINLELKIKEIQNIPTDQRTQEQNTQLKNYYKRYSELQKDIKKEDKGKSSLCETPHELLKNIQNDCWSCDITYLIIESIDRLTTSFYKKTQETKIALKLLGIGFVFWIFFMILKMVGSLGFTDFNAVFADMFKKFILVIFASALLVMPMKELFNWILTPFFSFSAGISMEVSNTSAFGNTQVKFDDSVSSKLGEEGGPINKCPYCTAMKNPNASVPVPKGSEKVPYLQEVKEDSAFSAVLKNSMLCIVCSLYRTISPPIIIGQSLVCYSTTDGAWNFPPQSIPSPFRMKIPNLMMWLTGITVLLTFFIISLLFPFYLIDAFFRIGFVTVLMPFLIPAYVFESTRNYAKNAINIILYSLFTFLSMSILLILIVRIFYTALGDDTTAIVDALAKNDILALFNIFQASSGCFLIIMCAFVCFISFKLIHAIDDVTSLISGINLASTGGIQAAASTAQLVASPMTFTKEMYDVDWGVSKTRHMRILKKRKSEEDYDIDNLKKGKTWKKYHTVEAYDRASLMLSQKISQHTEGIAQSIEFIPQKWDRQLNAKVQHINKNLKNINQAANFMFGTSTESNKTMNIPKKIRSRFNATYQFMNRFWIGRKAMELGFIPFKWGVRAGMFISRKAIIFIPKLIGYSGGSLVRKTGNSIAKNKYFIRTASATGSIKWGLLATGLMAINNISRKLLFFIPGTALDKNLDNSLSDREIGGDAAQKTNKKHIDKEKTEKPHKEDEGQNKKDLDKKNTPESKEELEKKKHIDEEVKHKEELEKEE